MTRRAFPALMRELVLGPLDMACSGYTQPLPDELHDEAATAHGTDGAPVADGWHVYPELAAAGLWTTPGDLARYAIAVQQAAAGASGAILGPELTASMLTPQVPSTSRLGGLDRSASVSSSAVPKPSGSATAAATRASGATSSRTATPAAGSW